MTKKALFLSLNVYKFCHTKHNTDRLGLLSYEQGFVFFHDLIDLLFSWSHGFVIFMVAWICYLHGLMDLLFSWSHRIVIFMVSWICYLYGLMDLLISWSHGFVIFMVS